MIDGGSGSDYGAGGSSTCGVCRVVVLLGVLLVVAMAVVSVLVFQQTEGGRNK